MTRVLSLVALIFIALGISAKEQDTNDSSPSCRLYMAVSSTSTVEEPKWGIYAGVDFDENTQLGEPDVAIQFHNLMAHNMVEGDDEDDDDDEAKSLQRKTVELLERFSWVSDSSGASNEVKAPARCNTILPGTALLAGYNGKLTNTAFNHSSSYFRNAMGEAPPTTTHEGRGASSHFYNIGLYSKQLIPTGFELFMDYGENFEVRCLGAWIIVFGYRPHRLFASDSFSHT